MEVELGLKITHTRDDITSFANLRISKDHSGPLFLSKETESVFLLISYLQGFKKENVGIKINKEGNQIEITGEKPVQEMVMMGWIMYKKEVELRAFRKAFRIPEGIILDKIKAKFNDQDSVLTIFIPKLEKGMCNESIEEVKESEEIGVSLPGNPRKILDIAPVMKEVDEEPDMKKPEEVPEERKVGKTVRFADIVKGKERFEEKSYSPFEANPETNNEEEENRSFNDEKFEGEETVQMHPGMTEPEESREAEPEKESRKHGISYEEEKRDKGFSEEEGSEKEEEPESSSDEETRGEGLGDRVKEESSDKPKKKGKFCHPMMIAGSGILVTIIVMAVGLIRSRRKRVTVSSDSGH